MRLEEQSGPYADIVLENDLQPPQKLQSGSIDLDERGSLSVWLTTGENDTHMLSRPQAKCYSSQIHSAELIRQDQAVLRIVLKRQRGTRQSPDEKNRK